MTDNWRDEALCAQVDTVDIFFPEIGESRMPAVRICRLCPARVRAACLADALATPAVDDWGIRAGTTPALRKKLRRKAAKRLAPVIPLAAPAAVEQPRRAA